MKDTIERFITDKSIGLVGASRTAGKWGNALLREITAKGVEVYPIHPETDEIDGHRCVPSVKDLPADVKGVIIAVRPESSVRVAKECVDAGIDRVWFQKGVGKGSGTPEAIDICRNAGIAVIHGVCPFMYYPPAGFHRVHWWLRKTLGRLPRELSAT